MDNEVDRSRGVGSPWLSQLASGMPSDALERLRVDLLEGATRTQQRSIEEDAEHARSVHARLLDRDEAAREFASLNAFARRLAALHDKPEVLKEIVFQARQLLSADVSFIWLRLPEEGAMRIEFTDGALGSGLLGLVIWKDEGVAGRVISTGNPIWTDSVLDDSRLKRAQPVDAITASEQLEGVLGVPLRVGADTFGVLTVASRRRRHFHGREVELLVGLASHAALALRNAELFESHREQIALLRRTNEEHARTTDLREGLTRLLLTGGNVTDLSERIAKNVGATVVVFDERGSPLTERPEGKGPTSWAWDLCPQAAWFDGSSPERSKERPEGVFSTTPITLFHQYGGCLVAAGPEPLGTDAVALLEIGASSVAVMLAWQRAVMEAEHRSRGEFLAVLLAEGTDGPTLQRHASAAELDISRPLTVVVLDQGASDGHPVMELAGRLARRHNGWSAQHAGQSVVLLPDLTPSRAREKLYEVAGANLRAAAGLASSEGGASAVRNAYRSARQTVGLLLALNRPDHAALATEMGIYSSLFSRAGKGEVAAFIRSTIGPLLDYDARHNRELSGTVEVFLAQAQQHGRTAEELPVHRNTLYLRLDKVSALLGENWRAPDRVLDIQLAFRLHRLISRV